jgi:cytoskeletal protein CcmA (bactofilin family)
MAALGSQSIASSYEQLLHVDRDGGGNTTTHVSVKDGDNGTTFGFTIASDALMMTSTNRLEFGDTGTYIHQSADGVLDLVSDTEIEINATTIDMNGALDLSGNAQLSGTVTVGADGSGTDVIFYSGTAGDNFSWDASEEKLTITGTNGQTALDVADGNLVVADNVDIEGDIDVNGTTNLDAVDIDGAVQIDAAVTVGADDQGYDFKFFGDTASAYMMWDTSVDDLVFAGAAGIDLDGDIDVNGTANLDNTDIDGTLAVDGTTISLDATTSLNIDNSNTSNGITIGTATSGVPISIGHTTSETTVNDNLVITGDIDANGAANFAGDITTQSKILVAASGQGIFGADDGNTGIRWEGSDAIAIDNNGNETILISGNGETYFQNNVIIDADASGLILGEDQDVMLFADDSGTAYLTRGTDATPHPSDTEGWMKFFIGNSADTYLNITGGEGGDAEIYLEADGGDDNADLWRMTAGANGDFKIASKSTGSYVDLISSTGAGAIIMAKQPAFMATPSSGQANISTGSSTVAFGSERFDQGSNFASNTFTAPRTGKYQFNLVMRTDNIDSASNYLSTQLVTSNITYQDIGIWDPGPGSGDWTYWTFSWSLLVDMDTNDTAYVQITQSAGAAQVDIDVTSYFSGFLAC